ncbi:uncharacterized protein LOC144711429 isoform X2 [Wolffia australiana]
MDKSWMDDEKLQCSMELIQLKREARLKGGFYVEPEAKLLFIIRIRGVEFDVLGMQPRDEVAAGDDGFVGILLKFSQSVDLSDVDS